jgi:hypothetical protein
MAVSVTEVRATGEQVLVNRVALPPFGAPSWFPAGSGYLGRVAVR